VGIKKNSGVSFMDSIASRKMTYQFQSPTNLSVQVEADELQFELSWDYIVAMAVINRALVLFYVANELFFRKRYRSSRSFCF
jgi:hypothetical protein